MGYISRLSAILYLPSFRWFWLGSSIQSVAQATQFLAIGWLVLEVTGSSAQLGLVIFLYGVPNVAFLLLAGVAADRFDRRYVLIITQSGVGCLIAILGLLTLADVIAIWHIYTAAAGLGVIQSLNMPARMTMVSDLVDQGSLLDAVAMQNAAVHAGRIVGPPIGGMIIEIWGLSASLMAIAACYLLSVACVANIGRTSQSEPVTGQSVFRNFADGILLSKPISAHSYCDYLFIWRVWHVPSSDPSCHGQGHFGSRGCGSWAVVFGFRHWVSYRERSIAAIRYVLYLSIDVDQCGAVRAVLDRFRLVRLVLVLLGDVLTGGNLRSRSSLAILIHYTPVRITFGCEGASDGSSPVHARFPFSRCVPSGSVGGRVELEYSLDPSSWCHRIGGILVWINAQRGP